MNRALPEDKIARMRALRAAVGPDGKPVHRLRDLAAVFGVSDITVSRYGRDIPVSSHIGRPAPRSTSGRC